MAEPDPFVNSSEGTRAHSFYHYEKRLITRDVDRLLQVQQHNRIHVNVTTTTLDENLARLLEPRAPRLFLMPAVQKIFLLFLTMHFAYLTRRYQERYRAAAYLRGPYKDTIRDRVQEIRDKLGRNSTNWEQARHEPVID